MQIARMLDFSVQTDEGGNSSEDFWNIIKVSNYFKLYLFALSFG